MSPTTRLCLGCYIIVCAGKIRKQNQQQPKSQKLWVEARKSLQGSSGMITAQIEAGGQKVLEGRSLGEETKLNRTPTGMEH